MHGWYVNGFDPEGELWKATTATEMLQERVPSHVQELVEKDLHGRSSQIKDLAVLAARLEDLLHSEAVERLADAYSVRGVSMDGELTEEDADFVTEAYMMVYVLTGPNYTTMYPGWSDTMTWVQDVNHNFVRMSRQRLTL